MNRLPTDDGRWIRVRMAILCGLLSVGLGLVVSAGYQLTIEDGDAWRELAEQQRQRRLRISPKRGTIYDRNGSALAVSVEVPSVTLDAVALLRGIPSQEVPVVARDAANRIAKVLDIDPAAVESKILAKRRFSWLAREVGALQVEELRKLSSRRESGERSISGLNVEGEARRFYPRRELGGPLLGFVAPDGKGKDGMEYLLNSELEGHLEQLRGLRDRSGRLIFADGISDDQALAGHDIYLSIDQAVQFVAERELSNVARTFEASGGSVVVLDAKTGEVLALASYPFFNPNDYRKSSLGSRRHRAVNDPFEPGSTMKMFTIAAGLQKQVITPTQKLYCEKGMMPVDNVVIRDTHPSEWLPITQVLAQSSNICAAKVGLSLGGNRLYEALRRFGFGQETGIELPGESSGTLRPRGRPWVPVETAAASFGQGISATNLQMALATAAIANGGNLMEPIIVKRIATTTGELVREAAPRVRRRVLPGHVAKTVAQMLVAVTEEEGTGTEAAIDGYLVAGKTATAQKTDPRTGRYSLDLYIASFAGFVPANDPQFVIAVTVDEPMVDHAGGNVAAPVFRRVAEMLLKHRGATPRGSKPVDLAELADHPDPARLTYEFLRKAQGKKAPVQEIAAGEEPKKGQVRIPDLTGATMRHALSSAVALGIEPKVRGSGLLTTQTPLPGQIVNVGSSLLLVFEPAS